MKQSFSEVELVRHWMESCGWLQGSIVTRQDAQQLISVMGLEYSDDIILIVASGSCDIANLSDPIIELSIGRMISKVNGNFLFNKNPRCLHLQLETSLASDFGDYAVELKAHEKISIKKDLIPFGILPETEIAFTKTALSFYVDWLASRYKRPAFPTEFDRRIDQAWDKSKRRKAVAKISKKLIGIYARVYPDNEINFDQNYSVDLLALVVRDLSAEDTDNIKEIINKYIEAFKAAKMDVGEDVKILNEYQVSVGTLKEYKRFNLDELSYRNNDPLPPEIVLN